MLVAHGVLARWLAYRFAGGIRCGVVRLSPSLTALFLGFRSQDNLQINKKIVKNSSTLNFSGNIIYSCRQHGKIQTLNNEGGPILVSQTFEQFVKTYTYVSKNKILGLRTSVSQPCFPSTCLSLASLKTKQKWSLNCAQCRR